MSDAPSTHEPGKQSATTVGGDLYDVRDVSGTGIAIGTGARVTINQIQIFTALPATAPQEHPEAVAHILPYRLTPFSPHERHLFTGREMEIQQLLAWLNQHTFVVLQGTAGIGKTSLLVAGLVPHLVEHGDLVVLLQDYARPVANLTAGLLAHARQTGLTVSDDEPLLSLAQKLIPSRGRKLILILDQMERLFTPEVALTERQALVDQLVALQESLTLSRFRLLLSLRPEHLGLLAIWADQLPGLFETTMTLSPLGPEQARYAIEHPLQVLQYPVSFTRQFMSQRLIPDLDELTPDPEPGIQPAELQIVCHWLYEAGRLAQPPQIDELIYQEVGQGKGSEGIVASHLEKTIYALFPEQWETAQQLLTQMAAFQEANWLAASDLLLDHAPTARIVMLLEKMVAANLLVWRWRDERQEYRIASHSLIQAARRLGKSEGDVQQELARLWTGWLTHNELPTRPQLRRLLKLSPSLNLTSVQLLWLVQASLAHQYPTAPWFVLTSEAGYGDLIRYLEDPDDPAIRNIPGQHSLTLAGLLLGVTRAHLTENDLTKGLVTTAAATHPHLLQRQTSALALLATFGPSVLDRLDQAISRRLRRAEIRGTLADANAALDTRNQSLALPDKAAIWGWRLGQRLRRYQATVGRLVMGVGLAGGLALGLWRFGIALLTGDPPGVFFAIYFYWGVILGAAATLGITLSTLLLLQPLPITDDPTPTLPTVSRNWAITGGTLCFGLAHLLTIVLNGLNLVGRPMVALAGFIGGLGIAWLLSGQMSQGMNRPRWSPLLFVFILFGLIQAGFWLIPEWGVGLTITLSASFYESRLYDWLSTAWPVLGQARATWSAGVALVDAAVTGGVLGAGMLGGWYAAARQIKPATD